MIRSNIFVGSMLLHPAPSCLVQLDIKYLLCPWLWIIFVQLVVGDLFFLQNRTKSVDFRGGVDPYMVLNFNF